MRKEELPYPGFARCKGRDNIAKYLVDEYKADINEMIERGNKNSHDPNILKQRRMHVLVSLQFG